MFDAPKEDPKVRNAHGSFHGMRSDSVVLAGNRRLPGGRLPSNRSYCVIMLPSVACPLKRYQWRRGAGAFKIERRRPIWNASHTAPTTSRHREVSNFPAPGSFNAVRTQRQPGVSLDCTSLERAFHASAFAASRPFRLETTAVISSLVGQFCGTMPFWISF